MSISACSCSSPDASLRAGRSTSGACAIRSTALRSQAPRAGTAHRGRRGRYCWRASRAWAMRSSSCGTRRWWRRAPRGSWCAARRGRRRFSAAPRASRPWSRAMRLCRRSTRIARCPACRACLAPPWRPSRRKSPISLPTRTRSRAGRRASPEAPANAAWDSPGCPSRSNGRQAPNPFRSRRWRRLRRFLACGSTACRSARPRGRPSGRPPACASSTSRTSRRTSPIPRRSRRTWIS